MYAAIHHDMKHTVLDQYMVSNVDGDAGEAWNFVDPIMQMSCHKPVLPKGAKVGLYYAVVGLY